MTHFELLDDDDFLDLDGYSDEVAYPQEDFRQEDEPFYRSLSDY